MLYYITLYYITLYYFIILYYRSRMLWRALLGAPGIDLMRQELHQLSPVVVAAALGARLEVVEALLVHRVLEEGPLVISLKAFAAL